MGEPAFATWWLVVFLATRIEAFGTESMISCHDMMAVVDNGSTTGLEVLPQRLRQMLELDVVQAVTCLDGLTMVEMMSPDAPRLGYGKSPVIPHRDGQHAPRLRPLPTPTPQPPRWMEENTTPLVQIPFRSVED